MKAAFALLIVAALSTGVVLLVTLQIAFGDRASSETWGAFALYGGALFAVIAIVCSVAGGLRWWYYRQNLPRP